MSALICGSIWFGVAVYGEKVGLGVFGFALLSSFGVVPYFFGRGEATVLIAEDGLDERQRSIQQEAVQYAYGAIVLVAVIGSMWELAFHKNAGPYTFMCFVGGSVHIGSVLFLRHRR